MKTAKCKYCEYRFKLKEYLDEEEKTMCFSCRVITELFRDIISTMEFMPYCGKKAQQYWQDKINNLTNYNA